MLRVTSTIVSDKSMTLNGKAGNEFPREVGALGGWGDTRHLEETFFFLVTYLVFCRWISGGQRSPRCVSFKERGECGVLCNMKQ